MYKGAFFCVRLQFSTIPGLLLVMQRISVFPTPLIRFRVEYYFMALLQPESVHDEERQT